MNNNQNYMRLVSHEEVERRLDEALKDDPIEVKTSRKENLAIFTVFCAVFVIALIMFCVFALVSGVDLIQDEQNAPHPRED